MLVCDGLPGHRSAALRRLVAARSWLRVYLAAGTVTDLARTAKNRLKRVQYRAGLVDDFLAATGLASP